MARKKTYSDGYHRLGIKIDLELYNKFKSIIDEKNTTITKEVTKCINRYVYRHKKD
jgi:hypothetical protein